MKTALILANVNRLLKREKEDFRLCCGKKSDILLPAHLSAERFPENFPLTHIGEQRFLSPDIRLNHVNVAAENHADMLFMIFLEMYDFSFLIRAYITFHTVEQCVQILLFDSFKNLHVGVTKYFLLVQCLSVRRLAQAGATTGISFSCHLSS